MAPFIASGQNCPDSFQLQELKAILHKIAIIGTDDRVARDGSNLNLEAAQGRLYCLKDKLRGTTPTKQQIIAQTHNVANATLAFDSDIALVSRHTLFSKDRRQNKRMENCYFEHIASGEIIGIADWEWPPMPSNYLDRGHQDYALIRLKRSPAQGKPVPKSDILIYQNKDISHPITIVSNYAYNLKNKESLTVTSCHRKGFYRLSTNEISNLWYTDCDTGGGSSGAQAYIEQDGEQKLFGLVSGEIKLVPDGGTLDPKKLATMITQFDESLFEAYERLKQRSSI